MARPEGERNRIIGIEDRGGTGDKRFRVRYVFNGERGVRCFASRERAAAWVRGFRRDKATEEGPIVAMMIDRFLDYQVHERHWRPGSQSKSNGFHRLWLMLRDVSDLPIGAVTEKDLLARDAELLADGYAIKTINECVIITGQFFRWCVDKGHRRGNPATLLKRRKGANAGKPGLTMDEAIRFRSVVEPHARTGDESAIVCLMALLLGSRACELVARKHRDVDAGGTILRSHNAKRGTPHLIRIPEALRQPLVDLAAKQAAAGSEWLFTHRCKQWPNVVVKRWCKRAGVPVITCQGMRGTHDSIAVEIGMAPDAVARATDHSVSVMKRNYLADSALSNGRVSRVEAALDALGNGNVIPLFRSQAQNDAASIENNRESEAAK